MNANNNEMLWNTTRAAYAAQNGSRPAYAAQQAAPAQNGYARPAYAAQQAPAQNAYRPAYTAQQAPAQNGYTRPAYNAQQEAPAQRSFRAPDMQNFADKARSIGASNAQAIADKARSTGYSVPTLIGIGLAAAGTFLAVIGLLGSIMMADSAIPFEGFFAIGFLIGLPSYILAGGLGHAVKCAWKVAKAAWFIVPVFPVDLVCGIIGLFVGLMLFIAVPIVFVLKAVHEKYGE